ncbi:MAG TPA: Gfo/Idh/MocA family oxidoreductase [Actinomycetota bacterium]|nr:Gfo/Idh/MocA family oxidoreductase [Actinomycetota bacterium]
MLRVGCVGTGFIAGKHLAALSEMPDVDIVAVADPVKERAEQAAERYGTRAYGDGLALLDSEDLDAVWLCVPPFAHGPLEHAAVDRSLPFFVEKPLALDLSTAASISAAVRQKGLLTGVGYHWRHLDLVEHAARLLQRAPARLVTGYWLDRTPAAPWWSRRQGSGGQVLEQTTHLFDLARLLVGQVDQVHAVEAHTVREELPDADAPTVSTTILHFRSGAIGTISSTCLLQWRHGVALQLVGDSSVVELSEHGICDHELRVVTPSGDQTFASREDPIAREDREFVAAVRGQVAGVRVPYHEALASHALAWAVDRSAREGVSVLVEEEAARD